jgi:hypothetical protein
MPASLPTPSLAISTARSAWLARALVTLGATAGVVLAVACSSDGDGGGFAGASSSSGASGGSSSGFNFGDAGGSDGGGSGNQCSADLQKVIDPSGRVVETCPPDLGCSAGRCVAACDAAAASKGTIGCNYVVSTPNFYPSILPPCFAIFVANGWGKAAQLKVTRGAQSYDVTRFGRIPVNGQPEASWPRLPATGLPPGEVAVLFMSSDPNSQNITPMRCPVEAALGTGTAVAQNGKGQGWRVTSDVPLTAYDIMPYGGASSFLPSAQLLLPTTAWGKNYVAMLPPRGFRQNGPFWGHMVAAEDNTTIELLPSVNLAGGGGVAAARANVKSTYTLNAGEYIQFEEGTVDMSGSIMQSDKPMLFMGGNSYICYQSATSSGGGCDSAHQNTPPVSALGSDYVAAPWKTRRGANQPESVGYRIMAPVAGTTLTFDPPVAGAPATLAAGQLAEFQATTAFRVKSQDAAHPFHLAQIMSGCMVSGGNGELGDEEFVNVVPPAQFLQKYVFFTDPSYGTTTLAVTRLKTASGFKDVNIKCLGNVTGFTPVGSSGEVEVATVDLVRDRRGLGTCANGSQTAESEGPFGITVWGLDRFSSYAYPAGGNVAPINAVSVPPVPK